MGETGRGMVIVLKGLVRVTRRDALGSEHHRRRARAGAFSRGSGAAFGQAAVSSTAWRAEEVDGIVIPPERLRALLVAEAELGERIMRALILRRVGLIEKGSGPVLLGQSDDGRLRFAARLSAPQRLSAHGDRRVHRPGRDLAARTHFGVDGRFPARHLPGRHGAARARRESGRDAARLAARVRSGACLRCRDRRRGAGRVSRRRCMRRPKGLSVAVFDCRAPGGQAGASSRIENYLGFPTGISGQALAGRAFVQAQKFGAHIAIPTQDQGAALRLRSDPDRTRRTAQRVTHADGGDRVGRGVSAAGHRRARALRRARHVLLGVAGRGEAVQERGSRAGRRRQFGGAGGGVSRDRMRSTCMC